MTTTIEIQDKLYQACKNNNLKMVKYILESPKLSSQIDLKKDDGHAFKLILANHNEEMLDYIIGLNIISPAQVKEMINNDFGLKCFQGTVENLQFYFYNDKYKSYLDYSYKETWCFRTAYSNARKEILQFLITEIKIPKNQHVQNSMRYERGMKNAQDLFIWTNELFDKQELLDKLENKFPEREMQVKQKKI